MATLDWPTGRAWTPMRMTFGASTPRSAWSSFYTGQQQSISHAGNRLRIDMTLPPCSTRDVSAAQREAFLMQLASAGDLVKLWHMARPVPAGRLRGVPFLSTSYAAGARTVNLQGGGTEVNLLSEAQAFNASTWLSVAGGTVTPNVSTRPNSSTVSADELVDSSTTNVSGIEQLVSIPNDSSTYTASIYVKATSGGTSKTFTMIVIMTGGTTVASVVRINTDTGAIIQGAAFSSITSTDSGTWWRLDMQTANNNSGNTALQFQLFPATGSYNSPINSITQTGSAIVWGAQLELGSSVTALSQPSLASGDIIGIGSQLCVVGYGGVSQTTSTVLAVPLALPLRAAVTALDPVTWFKPTGNFQLVGESVQALQYLQGQYQGAIDLQFLEVY